MKAHYRFLLPGLLVLYLTQSLAAARLLDTAPLGPRTIVLHFDEGEKALADYTEYWIYSAPDAAYYGQLDTVAAQQPAAYRLSSNEDVNYAAPTAPVRVGLKAKEQRAYYEYWVYLEWPEALQPGQTYTISLDGIGSEANTYTYTYAPAAQRSPAVHVNQVGMLAVAGRKYAYLSQWIGRPSSGPAHVDYTALEGARGEVRRSSDDAVVYSGEGAQGIRFRLSDQTPTFAGFLAYDRWFGTPVWEFEFSDLGTAIPTDPAETYYVYLPGVGRSYPFRIADDAYAAPFRHIARGLFHQRSGTARTAAHTPWTKPPDHVPGVDGFSVTYSNYSRLTHEAALSGDAVAFANLPAQATAWNFPDNPAPWMADQPDWARGGHFDAADYDVYPQHLNLPIQWSLVYLLAPDGFTDGQLDLPESGNGLPDLLDEARWTLDFFKNTKGPTGGHCGGKETTGYPAPSYPDGSGQSSTDADWYVYREDPATSYLYAAAAALYAAALRVADDPLSDAADYLSTAVAAYDWAEANATDTDLAAFFSGLPLQGYVRDIRLFAAAALYAETGTARYLLDYKDDTRITTPTTDLYVYEDYDQSYATWVFSLIPPDRWPTFDGPAQALQTLQRAALVEWSRTWGTEMLADERPMRHIAARFAPPLGGTSSSTPTVWPQIMAYHHTQDPTLLAQLLASNDFYLGGNPENEVYITTADLIGAEQFPQDPLHFESNYDDRAAYIPGLVLYAIAQPNLYDFRMFPPQADWPQLETNSDGRIYILQAEFTIHQNNVPAAAAYGYFNSLLNPGATVGTTRPSAAAAAPILTVAPNPATDRCYFSVAAPLRSRTARLRDAQGRYLADVPLRGTEARLSLALPPGAAGLYWIEVQTRAGTAVGTLIRQ